jgi:Phosphodiester glycosidase
LLPPALRRVGQHGAPRRGTGRDPSSADDEVTYAGPRARGRLRTQGRVRRLFRRPVVRVIAAVIAVFCCWAAFSVGQGATLGGGYYVWRSGLGITKDGRVIYVYGPALNVRELADLLQQAGAVEALQLDINPFWMSFMYYQKDGHPTDPTPVNLLAAQQQTAYRYYSIYSRDFTAVYARQTILPAG